MGKNVVKPGTNPDRAMKLEQKARRSGGGGGGGGASAPGAPVGAPAPTTPIIPPANVDKEYAPILGSLFQYLSPEDQKTQGSVYGLTPTSEQAPTQITGQVRNAYLSQERATQALSSLNAVAGVNKASPGYVFLNNALKLLQQYGGAGGQGMSRANYDTFATQLTNLLAEVKGNKAVAPYAALAQTFLSPTFTAGALMPQTKTAGVTSYGAPNPALFK